MSQSQGFFRCNKQAGMSFFRREIALEIMNKISPDSQEANAKEDEMVRLSYSTWFARTSIQFHMQVMENKRNGNP